MAIEKYEDSNLTLEEIEEEKKQYRLIIYDSEFSPLIDNLFDNIVVKYKELYPEIFHNYTYLNLYNFLYYKLHNIK